MDESLERWTWDDQQQQVAGLTPGRRAEKRVGNINIKKRSERRKTCALAVVRRRNC